MFSCDAKFYCHAIFRVVCVLFLIVLSVKRSTAQVSLEGATPSGLTPGAPAGSYALSGFENVNLYNGNLNFNLPIVAVSGRGNVGTGVGLLLEQKWTIRRDFDPQYGSVTNWPDYTGWLHSPSYTGSYVEARRTGEVEVVCYSMIDGERPIYAKTLTRLTITSADGTEYELRDTLNGGEPKLVPRHFHNGCPSSYPARGRTFVTADGTSATFISDTDIYDEPFLDIIGGTGLDVSGYLLLRDGSRQRFDMNRLSWARDRNGNKLTFTYGTNWTSPTDSITDALNRTVTTQRNVNDPTYGNCDRIIYTGFGGAPRTIYVTKTNLANVLRAGYTLNTYQQLFPSLNGSSPYGYFNPTVIGAVRLPNGKSYQFSYNSYGELARVVLPTGGAIEYDWAAGDATTESNGGVVPAWEYMDFAVYRRVMERRVYSDGSTLEQKMLYERAVEFNNATQSSVVMETRDASNNLVAKQTSYFYGSARESFSQGPLAYSKWRESREYMTEAFDLNGYSVLTRVESTLAQRAAVSWWTGAADDAPPNDPRITQTVKTFADTNQVSAQTFAYDQFNNQTDIDEYDHGAGAIGSFVRRTHTDYLTTNPVNGADYASAAPTASSIHARNVPSETWVSSDTSGTTKTSRTTFEYDNYAADSNHAPLVDRSSISGHDPAFTTAYTTRGNATAITRWLLPGTPITSYQQFDIAGNPVKVKDGRGYETVAEYDDRFGFPNGDARANAGAAELGSQVSYAFLTKVTNALGHSSYSQFDFYTGRAVDGEDINGIVSSGYSTNDPLDRPTKIVRAVGTAAQSQTTFAYDDTNRILTTTSDLSSYNDNQIKTEGLYDGLGRTFETRNYESGSAYIRQTQTFDALGRVKRAYNPYRTTGDPTYGWTENTFDALSRVTLVTTSDSAQMTTSYSGNAVTVTDQAGKLKRNVTDALGRLTRVDEPDIYGNLGPVGGPTQYTSYQYDPSDNLTQVSQGVQTRSFQYDSLDRLTSASHPESGTTGYGYDNNDNLTSKTDARTITTTYGYDAINRVVQRSYNDNPQTPTVNYFYDNQGLPSGAPSYSRGYSTGRLVAVTYGTGSSSGTYQGWDSGGRVTQKFQQTEGENYQVDATYNLANVKTTQTYPGAGDRRTVTYSFDGAGRLSSLSSDPTSYGAGASVLGIGYAAHGGVASQTLGNNLVHQTGYNSRLQPTSINLGSVLSLSYGYGTTTNNGNVASIGYTGGGVSNTQTFSYDTLNRLATAQENSGAAWTQTNGYDRYGNRTVTAGGGPSLSFDPANNRVLGMTYDNAGNVINDGTQTYGYDAENKIVKVAGAQAYTYDGEGNRVVKSTGENIRLVYGIAGELLAEFNRADRKGGGTVRKEYVYGAEGLIATVEASTTQYLTGDHLGSPRVATDQTGAVTLRRDFKPFGEEIPAGVGGRSGANGWGAAISLRQQFTGFERDVETGLDYAQARYYASAVGRFTSADPLLSSGRPVAPQSWNRYAYVLNNPLVFVDPSGLYECTAGADKCAKFEAGVKAAVSAMKMYDPKSKEYKKLARALGAFWDIGKDKSKMGVKDGLKVRQGVDKNIPGTATTSSSFVGVTKGKVTTLTLKSLTINVKSTGWDDSERMPGMIANEGANAQDARDADKNDRQTSEWVKEYTSLEADSLVMEKLYPDKPYDFKAGRVYDPAWKAADRDANRDKAIRTILTTSKKDGGYGLKAPKGKP